MNEAINKLEAEYKKFQPLNYNDNLLMYRVMGELQLYKSMGFVSKNFNRTFNRFFKRIGGDYK